jgi:alpha-galactosidase
VSCFLSISHLRPPYLQLTLISVGLNALSLEEERFHFSMWAINKSPLIIGAVMDPKKLSNASLAILSNKEVIAINQDAFAKQAQLVRRYTEEEYDIWLGELSGSRKVLGIANWKNASQSVDVDLRNLGIAKASGRDVWAAKELGINLSGTQKIHLAPHEMKLWLLSNITTAPPLKSTGYHAATAATLSGPVTVATKCGMSQCLPVGSKVGNITANTSLTFTNITTTTPGKKTLAIDFINYDYAFSTAWAWGTNTRNLTVSVNGGTAKRWAFPLSGGDWWESGRLEVEVLGFRRGANRVVVGGVKGEYAPDLVGVEVLE